MTFKQPLAIILILLLELLSASTSLAAGVIEYPIPTARSGALNLVTGPDGNLWFAEPDGDKIGYITPQGSIREFPLPVSKSSPSPLVVGADGNLWFTEGNPARIGRITPSGVITEFALPDAGSYASRMVSGPDNNLWFAISRNNIGEEVGRVSIDGRITIFPVPDSAPSSATFGFYISYFVPDRKNNVLYFTTLPIYRFSPSRIYRLTPDGRMTLFDGGYSSWVLSSLEIDDGGAFWITGYRRHDGMPDGNFLSRLSPEGNRTNLREGYFRVSLLKDSSGKVWVVSSEPAGGYSLARTSDEKKFLFNASGFPRCTDDGNGNFWTVISDRINYNNDGFHTRQRVGFLKSDGGYAEHDLGRGLKFTSLLIGPDKLPWFVDTDRNLIGKIVPDPPESAVVVSAASFAGAVIAPNSIASLFGNGLAASTVAADRLPLPETLAGVRVKVADRLGRELIAPLFFVSPMQINFLVPPGLQDGTATVSVIDAGGRVVSSGSAILDAVSPAVFSADATGKGLPAAVALRVLADGTRRYEPVAQRNAAGQLIPVPIDTKAGGLVFLILYGSGVRESNALSRVTATFYNGSYFYHVQPDYVGPQGAFVGLDQANILLPTTLPSGQLDLFLRFEDRTLWRTTNSIAITIK